MCIRDRVWSARSLAREEKVAIKLFYADTRLSPEVNRGRLRAFWSGAKRLCRAGAHPGIASIIDGPYADEDSGLVWFVMKLFGNGDLDKRISGSELGWDDRWEICSSLVEALAFCHGKTPALLHRDVRARNVLLGTNKEAVLADFDLSYGRVLNLSLIHISEPTRPY